MLHRLCLRKLLRSHHWCSNNGCLPLRNIWYILYVRHRVAVHDTYYTRLTTRVTESKRHNRDTQPVKRTCHILLSNVDESIIANGKTKFLLLVYPNNIARMNTIIQLKSPKITLVPVHSRVALPSKAFVRLSLLHASWAGPRKALSPLSNACFHLKDVDTKTYTSHLSS